MQKQVNTFTMVKKSIILGVVFLGTLLAAGHLFAASGSGTIGGVATNIRSTFTDIAKLIVAAAYVAGFGFAFASILKFKAHKDNPTQIPIGTPIALLFVGVALIFLPSVFTVTGKTVFGKGEAGSVSGSKIVVS